MLLCIEIGDHERPKSRKPTELCLKGRECLKGAWRGVVVNGLHKRRDMLLALDVGWCRVRTGRKEGRTEEGIRVALLSSQSD